MSSGGRSPGCVRGGDEEIDDHPVAHVETLLHGPETNKPAHRFTLTNLCMAGSDHKPPGERCYDPERSEMFTPHVAPLPGDDVEHGGDQEEGAQAQAVHQGRHLLPAVVRQAVQQRHAHEGRRDEELQRWNQTVETSR